MHQMMSKEKNVKRREETEEEAVERHYWQAKRERTKKSLDCDRSKHSSRLFVLLLEEATVKRKMN